MDHYLDIELRPDPEFPAPQLMNALFAKLHRALVRDGCGLIGVSFPGINTQAPHLGTRLRLHGCDAPLAKLDTSDWLTGMRDHVAVSRPTPVPADARHRVVRRVQAQSSPERLRRRLMRRHSLDPEQARQRIPDSAAQYLRLPFVQLRSTSSGQSFRLFIEHGPMLETPVPGEFSAYGLSQTATVPWF